jgi:hypothetical protein
MVLKDMLFKVWSMVKCKYLSSAGKMYLFSKNERQFYFWVTKLYAALFKMCKKNKAMVKFSHARTCVCVCVCGQALNWIVCAYCYRYSNLVKLTTHLGLVLRLRICEALLPLCQMSSWHVGWLSTGTNLLALKLKTFQLFTYWWSKMYIVLVLCSYDWKL